MEVEGTSTHQPCSLLIAMAKGRQTYLPGFNDAQKYRLGYVRVLL